jgi:hypothetical protein
MAPRVTLFHVDRTGRFHLVLRRGVDAEGRVALLMLKSPGFATRDDAEAARLLLDVELAANDLNYDAYETRLVIVELCEGAADSS